MSSELYRKLDEVLENELADRHSYLQINTWMLDEPTHQGKLWQILRELSGRRDSLQNLKDDTDIASDEIALLDLKLKKLKREYEQTNDWSDVTVTENGWEDDKGCGISKEGIEDEICKREIIIINTRKVERQKKRLQRSINSIRKKVKYIEEEVVYIISVFEKLSEKEKVKPLDDRQAQEEYWNTKLEEELNLRFLLGKPLDVDLAKTIMALDDNAPAKRFVINYLQAKQNAIIEHKKVERIKG